MSVLIDVALHIDKYLGVIIQQYGGLTYFILALIIFLETALILTPFLPGDSLLFITGTVAATRVLNIWLLFFLLSVAAILGDTMNYWIGHYFGERVFMKSRLFKKEYLARTHEFYEKHGGKTIVLARFIPIVRTFAPFVAGISAMNYLRFLVYNIVGGFLWVGIFMFAGYYFGGIPFVQHNLTLIILGVVVLSLIPPAFYVARKHKEKVKMLSRKEYLHWIIAGALALYTLIELTQEVVKREGIVQLDALVLQRMMGFWNPGLTITMQNITRIADTWVMVAFGVILVVAMLYTKRRFSALLVFLTMVFGLVLKEGLKFFIARMRPGNSLIEAAGYSFPSGHAAFAVIFFGLLLYLFKNEFKSGFLRGIFLLVNLLLILAIGFSRLYLQVHWMSDVLAGYALGLLCLSVFVVLVKFLQEHAQQRKRS